MRPVLRPYQEEAGDKIRQAVRDGFKRILFVGVTSFGKTNLFSSLALRAFEKGNSAWILTHRWTLFENTLETLARWHVPSGAFDANRPHDGQLIQVVMKDTLAARLKKGWRPARAPDVLIMDEADLAGTATWQEAVKAFSDAIVIGFTGTPWDGKGQGLGQWFQTLIQGPSPDWMMEQGFIARPRYMASSYGETVNIRGLTSEEEIAQAVEQQKPQMVGDAVAHYLKHGQELPFLCSAVNIAAAERFAAAWTKEGVRCEVIHSNLTDRLQQAIFSDMKRKVIRGLSSVDMISRGVDLPSVKYLACCRPTHSLRWWLQWLGRCVRKDGDTVPIVADHVGNLWRHGTVEMPRRLTLENVSRKEREKEKLEAVCQCANCFVFLPKFTGPCPRCGFLAPVQSRKLKKVKGSLKELSAKEIDAAVLASQARKEQGMAKTEGELVAQFMARGSSRQKAVYRARIILRARRIKSAITQANEKTENILKKKMKKRLIELIEELTQIVNSKEFDEFFPELNETEERRVNELHQAVSRHESEGVLATLGSLRKRNGFERSEVERLVKRFPGKLALSVVKNPRGGPSTETVSFTNDFVERRKDLIGKDL